MGVAFLAQSDESQFEGQGVAEYVASFTNVSICRIRELAVSFWIRLVLRKHLNEFRGLRECRRRKEQSVDQIKNSRIDTDSKRKYHNSGNREPRRLEKSSDGELKIL